MAVQLVLSEEIIDCFHFCAKKADYRQLFNDYPRFFIDLVENLEKVNYPKGKKWETMAKNARHLLDLLKQWHLDDPVFCKEILFVQEKEPELLAHFKDMGLVKDWDNFYNEYKSDADLMISCARKQGVDFKIECKGESYGNFLDRDNFLKSLNASNPTKPEPQAAPRRRTRIIDDNSWLTRASTPDNTTNEDDDVTIVSQTAEQKTTVPEKTNGEHSPVFAQATNSEELGAAPRRRTRIIDDDSWLTRASTPDNAASGDILEVAEQKTTIPEKTNNEHTPKQESLAEIIISHEVKTPAESELFQNTSNSTLNVAVVNVKEESSKDQLLSEIIDLEKSCHETFHGAETPLEPPKVQYLQEISDLKRTYQEKLEQLEANFRMKFEQQEREMKNREETLLSSIKECVKQEMTGSITDLNEKLLQLNEKQEESEEKSRMLRENDDVNRQHLDNRILELIQAQEEHMKMRENDSMQRLENLERKMEEMTETMKLMARNSAEENAENSRLQKENYDVNLKQMENRIQEQLKAQEEQMKIREDKLRMREQELDEKVNEIRSMEEHLDMKVNEIRLGEESLRRKLGEMMNQVVGNESTFESVNLDTQRTSSVQDNTIDTSQIVPPQDANTTEPSVHQSNDVVQSPDQATTADEPTSEDEELQQMEEQFQRARAEQDRKNELELRIARERRREINERAEEERRRLSGNLTHTASLRSSFHS